MIRTPTLLLVLALAGSPAAATLCIAWCDAEAASGGTAATCHQRASEGLPGILAAEHGCGARLQTEPFVREDVQRTASESVADHAVVSLPSWIGMASAMDIPADTWRPAPTRTPGTFVLRI